MTLEIMSIVWCGSRDAIFLWCGKEDEEKTKCGSRDVYFIYVRLLTLCSKQSVALEMSFFSMCDY